MFLNFVRSVQISGGIIVFYDVYISLCKRSNKKPSVVATELGINKSNVSNWKNNGYTPRGDALQKIADYFGVTTDYLLTGEDTKKAPTDGERDMTMDDFTYAMQNEAKDLTDMDKQILLSMAKQLNDARKKKDGESG